MDLLSPCHRASFGPHATGIKAKWMINSLTDHGVDIRGRGYKAMSGNCCFAYKRTEAWSIPRGMLGGYLGFPPAPAVRLMSGHIF